MVMRYKLNNQDRVITDNPVLKKVGSCQQNIRLQIKPKQKAFGHCFNARKPFFYAKFDPKTAATLNSSGTVTAKAAGTSTITARTSNGLTSSCTITVTDPGKVTGVTVSPVTRSMYASTEYTITANVLPSTATNKNVTWTSSNTSVATVDSAGKITAASPGTCDITAKTVDGSFSAPCRLTVTENPFLVSSINLSPGNVTIDFGAQFSGFVVDIQPTTATDKRVTWSSTNPGIASVDANGVVTGVSGGTCDIVATTVDGNKVASSRVTVSPQIHVDFVTVTPQTMNLNVGQTMALGVSVSPSNAHNQTYYWSGGDPSIATIDPATGVVTAHGNGTTAFSAISYDLGRVSTCNVTVTTPVSSISLTETQREIKIGNSHMLTTQFNPATSSRHKSTRFDIKIFCNELFDDIIYGPS